ncbi:hypothetical protein HUJ04_003734 [Dendroctonus ponderosae]|uniref:Zinc finger CCHC domain-containing protein 7 n=2 Tax=Dendroctonus ponderosae TaxID=77166 RepID=A0AAR5P394_DENPD|nr:hypothetical protein HUJ04_003734 [Dendroctonus ponderosae]
MLTDEVIDEDIEALLYAQIYYGKSDHIEATQPAEYQNDPRPSSSGSQNDLASLERPSTGLGLPIDPPEELPQIDQTDSTPAPLQGSISSIAELDSGGYIPLGVSSSSTIHTYTQTHKVPRAPRRVRNIRIRQCILPSKHFWNRLKNYKDLWTNQCEADLKRFEAGKLSEKVFFNKLNKRFSNRLNNQITKKNKQNQCRSYILNKQQGPARSEVISLLSDSDDSSGVEVTDWQPDMNRDCANEQVEVASSMPREEQPEHYDNDEDDDDIVYIEPPPVPFINLEDDDDDDDDDEEEKQPEDVPPNKLSQEFEDCSNDFLVPTTSSEKFNFSLHGSDFQDVEFARPAQPTDVYETESSTSTSEMPKDFNNSVKTIVFNEIDFPREDLFEEDNLDKFRELIGPMNTEVVEAQKAGKVIKPLHQRDSSSSSESDYAATTLHQNLPYLSPMQVLSKKHRPSSKHKNSSSELEEDDVASSTPVKKLKKHDSMLGSEVVEGGAKRVRKKKKKLAVKDVKETEVVGSFQPNDQTKTDVVDAPRKAKRKKKRRRSGSPVEVEVNHDPDVLINTEDTVKKKSKKRKETVANIDVITTYELLENQCFEKSPKKKKSKKKRLSSATKSWSDGQEAPPDKNVEQDVVEQIVEKGQNCVDENEESAGRKEMEGQLIDVIDLNTSELDDQDPERDKFDESDDVILIEKEIPIHTIESSDSEVENESGCFSTVAEELHLANVQLITDRLPEILQDPKYDIDFIQSKMSDDPEKWKILPADQQIISVESGGPRCRRCRERGHISQHCRNRLRIPSCSMCGFQGHQEPRCPHKICLNCGKRSSYTTTSCMKCANQINYGICYVCKLPGHMGNSCPDLWRRYYLTIKAGPIVKPEKADVRPRERQWCSGCSRNGHFEFECTSCNWIREYPITTPFICSFKDVYPHSSKRERTNVDSNSEVPKTTQGHGPVVENATKLASTISDSKVAAESQAESAKSICPASESCSTTTEQDPARSPTASRSPIFTRDLRANRRDRELANQAGKPRLNPLSVMQDRCLTTESTQYKPYQSVLNPCSVLGACSPASVNRELPIPNESFGIDINPLSNVMEGGGPFQPIFNGAPLQMNYETPAMNYLPPNRIRYGRNMQIPPNPAIRLMGNAAQDYNEYADFTFDNRYFDYSALGATNCYVDFEQPSASSMAPGCENEPNSVLLVDEFEKHFNVEHAVAEVFGRSPMSELKNFIVAEIDKLDKLSVRHVSVYKNMLLNIEQLKSGVQSDSVRHQIYSLYKSLNMFLFGVHKLSNGVRNLNFLQNFVYNTGRGLQDKKRADLVKAYGYIYGGEHANFNYRKGLNSLVFGQGADKRKHFS